MATKHSLLVDIAHTLEQVQEIDPDLYALWYSKLYPLNGGPGDAWTPATLSRLKGFLKLQPH